jgi:hypothetical protein
VCNNILPITSSFTMYIHHAYPRYGYFSFYTEFLSWISGKNCSHSTSTSLHPIHRQFLHLYISTCICRMWVFFFLHKVLSWVLFLEGIVIVVQVLPLVDISDSNEKDSCLAINIILCTTQVLLLFPLPVIIIIITCSLNISKL